MKKYSSVDRFYKLYELFAVDFNKSEQDSQRIHQESNVMKLTEIDQDLTA